MMKRKLYFHIGVHRTATTSIQHFMHDNFLQMVDRGILYPYRVRRHVQLVNSIFNGTRTVSEVSEDFNSKADSKKAKIHSIVVSDEDISFRKSLKKLSEFKEWFDVKVIVSLRRQDLWLESWYLQNIKWQWDKKLCHLTFPEFIARRKDFHWIDYDKRIAHIESLFGKENIFLSVFERDQMPHGPVADFCAKISLSNMSGLTTPPHENASYEPEFAEFIRHLPLDQIPSRERHQIGKVLQSVHSKFILTGEKANQRIFSFNERAEILADYNAGNHEIARKYFDRDELFFDPLPTKEDKISKLEIPGSSTEVLKRYVAPLILEMYEQGLFKN